MSSMSASTRSFSGIEALHAKWGWIVALGVIYLITGFIALGSVLMATVASVFVVGVMMLIAGVAEVINANPLSGARMDNLFSTHLATENRIAALEQLAAQLGHAPVGRSFQRVPSTGRPWSRCGPWS